MKSYIVRKTQKAVSLKRDKSLQSEDGLRASSIAQRQSESSERQSLAQTKQRAYAKSMTRTNALPYEVFVRELKIKLPSPKQKFYQFLRIAPFNRVQQQNELIGLFLKKINFFKVHQPGLIVSMARKVKMIQLFDVDDKMMVIVLEGSCKYKGLLYTAGMLVNRQEMNIHEIHQFDPKVTKLLALNRHEYLSFLYGFINQEMVRFKEFINSIQTFKMFTEKTLQKFTQNMTLHYYLKGEKLYRVGDEANTLFIVFTGLVARNVIIELEKINKIPPYARKDKDGNLLYEKFEREVRILTKEYEHKIEFGREDMVGVTEIIENVALRKEEIDVNEDSIMLGIDRSIVQENLDDYILDRLKKYNLKKYPASYDELCENYLKEKLSTRKMEERKIVAMQNELRLHQSDRRRQKIEFIIRMYENNIKNNQKANLKKQRLDFQMDKNK